MSVRDINSRQMETLKRSQAREISKMEDGHQNLKADLKEVHQKELVDIKGENLLQVDQEALKKEKVLEKMSTHLDSTKRLTEKELRDLKTHVQDVKTRENEKLLAERDRTNSNHELYLEDLNYRYQDQIKKVNAEGQGQVQDVTDAKQSEVSQKTSEYNKKINDQSQDFVTRFQGDTHKYKKVKDDQDIQFKKERMEAHTRQQVEVEKRTTGHGQALEKRDDEFRKGIKSQDQFFEKKYADTIQVHGEDFKRLSERHEKVINKMKETLAENLSANVTRADDPFYSFSHLSPKLTQYPDRVEVSVEVPEHAKGDLTLATNNKELILNFNRRYDDQKKENGVSNKLHKVESFTTRLVTEHVLNPKSVKSNYDNGVMTYVVSKA